MNICMVMVLHGWNSTLCTLCNILCRHEKSRLKPHNAHTGTTSFLPSEITVAPQTLNSIGFSWVPILTNPILSYEERSRYWSRGHLIYHSAWNPEKIFDQGGYSILFSPSTHRIKPAFFPSKKWVMTAVKEMGFVTEILLLPSPIVLLSSPLGSFTT